MGHIELWGGVECSHNRVGDNYFDQISRNGHAARISDLALFARMGIKKLRYPVLWEHVAPESLEQPDWSWADERLNKLRQLGIDPIVGFVHHGSGPRYTSLVSDNFAPGLAAFAAQVAARYPWVKYYTPVNEPLTTARFSGLYGFWYPHGKDDKTFLRALFNQVQGTRLAMKAIRQVNPDAQLVQTEDMGYTQSTPLLAYQAEFENTRRWLSLDLLTGKVTPQHPLWDYLIQSGLRAAELHELANDPMPPDVVGINYYITSERYLDEHLVTYPLHTHGTNGRHKYADVETVRVKGVERAGVETVLTQAWERYQLPISVTEAHICCTREEQMRWFKEIWDVGQKLKASGIPVQAVTAWALLGSFDWNSLLTQERNFYESGVFDLRGGAPRPTAMFSMLQRLARTGHYAHPVLETKGWWDREERYEYKHEISYIPVLRHEKRHSPREVAPVLITGATGTLGQAFARICEGRGLSYKLLGRKDLDIADPDSVEAAIQKYKPWAIVNTAGYVRVDEAEEHAASCYRENTEGAVILAEKCRAHDIQLLTFSTDLVFDGQKSDAYTENDKPNPRNVYGTSKMLAEQEVLKILPGALVVRTSAFFGSWDHHNFIYRALHAFVSGNTFRAASDVWISPTYVPDLVHTSLDLLIDRECGIWHLTNQGTYTWAQFAELAATIAKLEDFSLEAVPVTGMTLPAYRPQNTALRSIKADLMPSVLDALYRCVQDIMMKIQPGDAQLDKKMQTQELENIFETSNTGTK